jgi:hypothetical protein
VVRGQQADWRADVYGLGACLYAMLTGRPPGFDPATTIPPRSLRAGVPRGLDAIVRQAMAPDPDDRFQTVQAVAAALARSAADADGPPAGDLVGVPAEPPTLRGAPPPDRGFGHEGRWLGWTLALIGLAAVLVVVGVTVAGDQLAGLLGLGREPTTETTEAPGTTTGSTAIRISTAQPYDPPRGDGTENDETAGNAIDRRPDTSWTTEGYNSASFGQLKDGVGLVLDLGSARRARQLDLSLTTAGADFTLYAAVADDVIPPSIENGWQEVGSEQDAARDVEVDLSGDAHRYYLVWFTSLPSDGARFRAGIREASFKS